MRRLGKDYGKNVSMKVAKVTSKGQITIPQDAREALGIDDQSYLEVSVAGDEIRLRKLIRVRPLSDDDPIWRLVGTVAGTAGDVSENHDRYLADGEVDRWRESS
jgi:AbrB family looped-hinge helix DNA binding protein